MESIEAVIEGLRLAECAPKQKGGTWQAKCPAHADKNPSLSLSTGKDGTVLVKCFAGCSTEAVMQAINLPMTALFPDKKGGGGGRDPHDSDATVQPGLSLKEYSEAKGLPIRFLMGLGLKDAKTYSPPAVEIPYLSVDGRDVATRYRIGLVGDAKFRWKKGSKPYPYGLNRLSVARKGKRLIIVEGESDAQTLWFHEYPALGLPGASTWKDEYSNLLEGIDTIYVVIEPDSGGEALLDSLSKSPLVGRILIVELQGVKDVSELHVSGAICFKELLDQSLSRARPLSDVIKERGNLDAAAAYDSCKEIATSPDILGLFFKEYQQVVAGEERIAKLLFLAIVSRLLAAPISVVLKGPSSGGKSFILENALQFFPESAYFARTGISERALIYSNESLKHRVFVLYEAAALLSEFTEYVIRSLLSEGRISYETVIQTQEGPEPLLVERDGPTALLMTTTAVSLHPENETRLISITVADTPAQTRAVVLKRARVWSNPIAYEPWHALQVWLQNQSNVVDIPFATGLAELVDVRAVRMRRDFSKVICLITAHAVLHQASRERNEHGAIIATYEDYATIRELIGDLIAEGVGASVSETVRSTVAAVEELTTEESESVTVKRVGERLKIDKGSASRRINVALKGGFIVNTEPRKGGAMKLVMGEPLPTEDSVLPTVERLREHVGCKVARDFEGTPPPLSPPEPEIERVTI